MPEAFDLAPGEAADCKSYDTLIELPERVPDALDADKAYDADAIGEDLKQRVIRAVIPPKSNRTKTIRYSRSTGDSAMINGALKPTPCPTTATCAVHTNGRWGRSWCSPRSGSYWFQSA
jgi:hypothetical protein